MSPEPMDVRLARLEEGMVRLHEKISSNHEAVMTALGPMKDAPLEIARMKQNNWWVMMIATVAVPSCLTVLELWIHH